MMSTDAPMGGVENGLKGIAKDRSRGRTRNNDGPKGPGRRIGVEIKAAGGVSHRL